MVVQEADHGEFFDRGCSREVTLGKCREFLLVWVYHQHLQGECIWEDVISCCSERLQLHEKITVAQEDRARIDVDQLVITCLVPEVEDSGGHALGGSAQVGFVQNHDGIEEGLEWPPCLPVHGAVDEEKRFMARSGEMKP